MTDTPTLGQTLRQAREATGEGLRQTAVQLDISAGYLSKIERDLETPSRDLLERMAFELSLDTDPLLRLAGVIPSCVERALLTHPDLVTLVRSLSHDLRRGKTLLTSVEHWVTDHTMYRPPSD